MSRNYFWRTLLIIGILAWAVFEIYPPVGKGLAVTFRESAERRDETFKQIVTRLDALQSTNSDRQFGNVMEAIGTNDITRYFPLYPAKSEVNPTRYILDRLQHDSAGKLKFGLDLQGGVSFLVGVDVKHATGTNSLSGDTNAPSQLDTQARESRILSQAIEVLRKRVDKLGVAEPLIQPAGNDQILIQLPGLSEEDRLNAVTNIQRAAFLEFKLVHENSRELIEQGLTEPGYEVLKQQITDESGHTTVVPYLVKRKAEMTGKYIRNASFIRDPVTGSPEIEFTLNSEGADIFATLTHDNIGRAMAIVLDGVLYSAPVIQSEIPTGRGQITGHFTDKEAFDLAGVLENPLEAPVSIKESHQVEPSLGKDTIKSGMRASIIGIIAVAGFMLCYYLLAGLVADVALMLNIIILLAVMCSFGTTLTLPGIAGVVLTIGMAVDANVLIFERIREEIAAGKSMRGALAAGYDKAFSTILDSHVTTLISSVVLILFGNGPVKGFGVTLTIGVALSLFTALVITRVIFDFLIEKGMLKSMDMFHLIRGSKLDFMKYALPAFVASWTLIAIGNGYGIYRFSAGDMKHTPGVQQVRGVDFAGGDEQVFTYANKVDSDRIRKAIEAKFGAATITYQTDMVTKQENLRITTDFNTAEGVWNELKAQFPDAKINRLSLDKVGPTVGAEITQTAIVASALALFGILIYVAFRYEFSFAVGAVIAIIHDVLMTMGWFFLTGRQLNAPIVAAVLTIIGFSINDTVVIFDRIREDLKLGVRGSFKEIINQALNQTLSRTIITSGTVFLATLSLYFFGGGVINDFAFTFLVGIITGTYSSIYIASFIVYKWHKGQRPAMAASVNIQSSAQVASTKP